jgi:hypothetical protein
MDARFVREPRPQRFVAHRRERDVAGERAHVEARPPDDERALSARCDRIDRGEGIVDVPGRRVALVRIEEADEVVRDAGAIGVARRRRPDRHPAIDLT